jgi:threonine aldolase
LEEKNNNTIPFRKYSQKNITANKLMQRKHFLKLSAAATFFPSLALPVLPVSALGRSPHFNDKQVMADFIGDGLNFTPAEYAQLLVKLTTDKKVEADNYSLGGSIEALEIKFAAMLGKEAAIFMPTGTLANQLAIRVLAGNSSRVIVQEESHVYNDTGDACQVLSNLNLIPLGAGKASFTLDEVSGVVKKSAGGRVPEKIGVISIESPVRRKSGEVFDYEEMKKISSYAREQKIKMHLDGARIFLAPAYTGVSVMDYTSLFDTVYVSLYKYFNAASGAILAGPKEIIAPMYNTRRMFGSGLHQAWPLGVVADFYADGFNDRFAKAVAIAEDLITRLKNNNNFEVLRVSQGTNIFSISVKGTSAAVFVEHLNTNGVVARIDKSLPNGLILQVNESLLNTNAAALEKFFIKSLEG